MGENLQIPDAPKTSLGNYLLDLTSKEDKKEAFLYLNDIECFIEEIWNDIVEAEMGDLNIREFIPKKLNICSSTLYGYKNGRKAVPIQKVFKLLEIWEDKTGKSKKELEKKIEHLHELNFSYSTHSPHQKTILPEYISPKLTYLIGWMCGDGHLKKSHNYLVKVSEKSKPQLKRVLKPLFKELFNVEVPIFRRYKGGYAIQIGSKPIFRFFKNVLNLETGKIPGIVEDFKEKYLKHFLMGIFDSEGHVADDYLNSKIVISQKSKKFLEKIQSYFKKLDTEFTGPYKAETKKGVWHMIQIRKKSDILKFAEKFKTYHIDKQETLESLVNKIGKNWNG